MNTFLPSRYDERIQSGAVALQIWDGARDARVRAPLGVFVEREDPGQPQWTLDQAIGFPDDRDQDGRYRFPKRPTKRHPVNLHAVCYGEQISAARPKQAFEVRIVDDSWRYIPRRLRVPIPATADPSASGQPLMRIRRTAVYPGPAYDVISGSTGMRGRVTFGGRPARWVRVIVPALSGIATDPPRAVAHGDDQGEFLLIVPPAALQSLSATHTFSLPITIFHPPVAALTPDQERAIKRDRIVDVPLETIGAAQAVVGVMPPRAALDRIAMGWTMPPGYITRNEGTKTFTAGKIQREVFAH